MPQRDPDAPQYLTPGSIGIPQAQPKQANVDMQNYDTLKRVHAEFKQSMIALHQDFNAFVVLEKGTDQETRDTMMRNIAGRQYAFDVLSPLYTSLDTAIKAIDANFKG